jgi:prepilin-type N-terminal cleavage/methylation domain-containing protein
MGKRIKSHKLNTFYMERLTYMSALFTNTLIKGFTLFECLTVVALLAIFLMIAGRFSSSLFARYTARNEVHASAQAFMTDAQRLRSMAQSQKSTYSMLPLCNNSWESGWMAFANPNLDFLATPSPEVLWKRQIAHQVTTSPPKGTRTTSGTQFADVGIKPGTYPICTNREIPNETLQKLRHLSFNPVGSAITKSGGFIANRIVFWSKHYATMEYQVIMSDGGRLRLCQPSTTNPQCKLTF